MIVLVADELGLARRRRSARAASACRSGGCRSGRCARRCRRARPSSPTRRRPRSRASPAGGSTAPSGCSTRRAARRREELLERRASVYADPSSTPGAAAEPLLEAARARAAEAKEREEAALEGLELTAPRGRAARPPGAARRRARGAARGARGARRLVPRPRRRGRGAESALVHVDRVERARARTPRSSGSRAPERAAELVREAWRHARGVQALARAGARGAVRRAAPRLRGPGRGRTREDRRAGPDRPRDLARRRWAPGRWAARSTRDWGWGSQDDGDSIAAIHHAIEARRQLGSTRLPSTGFGHSEAVVGRAIAGLDLRPFVFTKGGQPEGPNRTTIQSLKADSLRRELEGSLERLGLDGGRPLPDPLADPRRGDRGGLGGARRAEGGGARAPHRRLQLLGRAARACAGDRPRRDAAAALLADPARRRARDPPLLRGARDRRDRLLADGLRDADRLDDPRADRGAPRRRLAHARPRLPGAEAVAQPGAGRAAEARSRPARRRARCGRGRVDAAQPGRRRGHHRLPPARQVDPIVVAAGLELAGEDSPRSARSRG